MSIDILAIKIKDHYQQISHSDAYMKCKFISTSYISAASRALNLVK